MNTPPRLSWLAATALVLALFLAPAGTLMLASPATAQDASPVAPTGPATGEGATTAETECILTRYPRGTDQARFETLNELRQQPVQALDGQHLKPDQVWVIPDGSQPVLVLDSTTPLGDPEAAMVVAGLHLSPQPGPTLHPHRYVADFTMPFVGPVLRTAGLKLSSGECEFAVVLTVDRSPWSTVAGTGGLSLAVLAGLLAVLIGRRRAGSWHRRFLAAAPFGLLAGLGQAVVLLETGVVSPLGGFPWWLPAAGLGLAAVLPLTRWRRRAAAGDAPLLDGTVPLPAPPAALSGWQLIGGFARTEVATVHRAITADGRDRALVKVAIPERAGEPATRWRLEREAQTLSGLDHPNLVTLRQTVPGAEPPALVFGDVAGAPLARLPVGSLSGPQVVTVTLGALAGLGVLHARGLVHRVVHPEHIWLDTDGRVVLANLELAAAGVEHAVAPEGTDSPYAGPQQRTGQVLDARADLYACGELLREWLPEPVPEPLAALIGRTLTDEPADRPESAEQLVAELQQAASEGYGADWASRGALAGAVAANAAVVAAAAGYGLGSAGAGPAGFGAGGAGAAGLGQAAGSGGVGGLGPTGSGGPVAAGPAPAVGAGSPVAAGSATTTPGAAAPVAGVAGGSSGKVAGLVNAGVAVVAGAAIGITSVLVVPEPAVAQPVVITPEQARVIFIRTVDEGRSGTFDHIAPEGAANSLRDLLENHTAAYDAALTEVEVGVPPGQDTYPAYFIGTALLALDDTTVSLFARFDRESADQPWIMTTLVWSTDQLLSPAATDDDGWLAPGPTTRRPALSYQELAYAYVIWAYERWYEGTPTNEAEDDRIVWLPHPDSFMVELVGMHNPDDARMAAPAQIRAPATRAESGTIWEAWYEREVGPHCGSGDDDPDERPPYVLDNVSVVGLVDELALVTFTLNATWSVANISLDYTEGMCEERPVGSCTENLAFIFDGEAYRRFGTDFRITLHAWVPLVDQAQDDSEDVTVLVSDPIVSVTRPSTSSIRC